MVAEVNKIIAGELLSHRPVVIPGVGTLYVAHRNARRLSRQKFAAPRNEIDFRPSEEDVSLVELIRRVAECDEAQAQAIFDRWLAKTREGEVLTLEGIGILRHRAFTPDPAFAARLNPAGEEVVTLQPRMNRGVVGIAVAAIAVAIGVFGYIEFGPKSISRLVARSERTARKTQGRTAAEVEKEKTVAFSESAVDATSAAAVTVGASHSAEKTSAGESEPAEPVPSAGTHREQASDVPVEIASTSSSARPAAASQPASDRMQAGWCYVVFGVFSTEENAVRCREQLLREMPSLAVSIYPFGAKFMVSPYAAQGRDACENFMREHRSVWPDLWIYVKK